MQCRLCLEKTEKLVDSHIIAQSIHALSIRPDNPTGAKLVYSNDIYPKSSKTGIYDQFLCSSCENIFQKWEGHALEFFRQTYKISIPTNSTHIKLDNFDYSNLKLFFMSILWKADTSKNDFYRQVNIGKKHHEILREFIKNQTQINWQNYAIFMERFNSNRPAASIMRSPQKSKMEDITFYTFYMAAFKVHIKCDSREIPKYMSEHFLRDNKPLFIPLIQFEGSQEESEYINASRLPKNTNLWQNN